MNASTSPKRTYASGWRKTVTFALAATLAMTGLNATVSQAESAAAATATCDVQFEVTESSAGFTHPGVGLTAEVLGNARAQIDSGAEPWTSYFEAMSTSPAAAISVASSNASASDPTVPASDAFNSQSFNGRFISDGLKAYTQALMYVLTGEQAYRTNAMKIIRVWEKMDPAKYEVFADSHIHTGIPLNRMVTAAEILRYGGCADDETPWTDADTVAFSDNLITPVIETFQHDQNHFMNQHNYPLLGAMAGYIFLDDADRYAEAVEWFTVNSTADDRGFNGSVERLFRLVDRDDASGEVISDPRVQHVEMGRDQAHGGGDITNAYMLARLMMAQGTKVDPEHGTVSNAADAVGPYEFLDDRILAAADYFWQFMLGYDTEWTPVGYAISQDGTVRDTYDRPSNTYRGRYNTASFWDLYYYYTYERGIDLESKAPYLAEAFSKRLYPEYYYRGSLVRSWDNVDGGGDFWLYTPAQAAGSSVPVKPTSATTYEVEHRYTNLSGNVQTVSFDTGKAVKLTAGAEAAKIAFLNASTTSKRFSLRVRTDELTELRLSFGLEETLIIPDTGGQWRDIVIDLTGAEALADLVYIETIGEGGSVEIDSLRIDTSGLTPVRVGTSAKRLVTVADWTAEQSFEATGGAGVTFGLESGGADASMDTSAGELTFAPTSVGSWDAVISASNAESLDADRLTLIAAPDRQGALDAARTGYDDSGEYTAVSRRAYDAALEQVNQAFDTAQSEFQTALNDLVAAVDSLALVSPQTKIGSIDYVNLLASSTAGVTAELLIDDDPQTGTVYGQASDLAHVFNFGPFAKVQADKFGLRSNIFEDRLANSAVFGSNDGTSWTRLTPGVTTMTQDFQTLDVAEDLRDDEFQYIKVQILEPQPDVLYGTVRNLFEITEFHIFGERSEASGEITKATVSAPGSIKSRVVPGREVRLDFESSAAITETSVTIAGVPATVTSANEGTTWMATALLPADAEVGMVLPFTIDHTTSSGIKADQVTTTSDGSTVFVSTNAGMLDGTFKTASVSAAAGTSNPSPPVEAAKLFDENIATYTDTRVANGRAALIWDFGDGASVSISGVDVLVRQDQYGTSRLSTLRFEGSDDGLDWTPVTSNVQATSDWQRLKSTTDQAFRFIRLTNGNFINLAETRIFGVHTPPVSVISSARLRSSNPLGSYAVPGDTVTLDITTTEEPRELSVSIDGAPAAVSMDGSATKYRATVVVGESERIGTDAAVRIDHVTAAGDKAITLRSTTDGSTVRLGSNDNLVTGFAELATAITLNGGRDTSTTSRSKNLFDNSLSTFTDARVNAGSADVTFDLGDKRTLELQEIELAMRQDNFGVSRVRNLRLLASNDRQKWDTLVSGVQGTLAWQSLPVADALAGHPYRYLRLTNGDILNVAELRLYGQITSPIVALEDVKATTYRNDAPVLPDTVTAKRADGTSTLLPVSWQDGPADRWATTGVVEVTGVVSKTNLPAKARVTVLDDGSSAPPRAGSLNHNNGHETGLLDGTYRVSYNLWWGENARRMILRENGEVIAERELTFQSPRPQSASVDVSGKKNGTYRYEAELINSSGGTRTAVLTVEVRDANPGKPSLTSDNWDGDGDFTLSANMWWGTNATSYVLLHNGDEIARAPLNDATPAAQRVAHQLRGLADGEHTFVIQFQNAAGVTESDPLTVKVRQP